MAVYKYYEHIFKSRDSNIQFSKSVPTALFFVFTKMQQKTFQSFVCILLYYNHKRFIAQTKKKTWFRLIWI